MKFPMIAGAVPFALCVLPLAAYADDSCPAQLPDTMRAVQLVDYGGPDKLRTATLPRPSPGAGEVLVEVAYSSVNPIDWKLREGLARNWWPLELPAILGRDISGVVVAVGTGVDGWTCGDAVVAMLDETPTGGYAEYVATKVGDLAKKPANLSFAEAAAFPLVSMTAYQALIGAGGLEGGERVLVHGGAGGVGSMAVQLAKWRGAHVTTTASARNHDYVKSIGADVAIDYKAVPFESVAKDMDVVLDTIGGDTTTRSVATLKRGGRLVTIAGRLPTAECTTAGVACKGASVDDDPRTLQRIADLFGAGKLRIHVDAEMPLENVGEAHELNRAGHTRGKIVIKVGTPAAKAIAKS